MLLIKIVMRELFVLCVAGGCAEEGGVRSNWGDWNGFMKKVAFELGLQEE